jgi:transcriptional regulator with XRE-family HTH domain
MLGNKKIMGRNIQYYMDKAGIDRSELAKALGVPYSSLTDWINGNTYPRIDKIEKMAKYFHITKADLVEEHSGGTYYTNAETARAAQEIFDNEDMRILFDAARDSRPEDLRMAADMLKRFKESNPDA